MSVVPPGPLVSCEWLKENLKTVKVLDASWYLASMERSPGVKFDAEKEFIEKRIAGAARFNLDEICELASPHPHMLPSPDFFAQCVSKLGVARDSVVVVYDGKGLFSAPRAWTMFQAFGHPRVHILDGGLPAWVAAGYDLETGQPVLPLEMPYAASGPADILNIDQVKGNIEAPLFQLVDARSMGRYLGDAPEPRPIESGHIAGSFCLPFADVCTPEGKMKDEQGIREAFSKALVDVSKPIAVTCGSGVSACVLRAALAKIGVTNVPLYDGAYAEWKVLGYPTFKGIDQSPYAK